MKTIFYAEGASGWGATFACRPTASFIPHPRLVTRVDSEGVHVSFRTKEGQTFALESSADNDVWVQEELIEGDGR